MLVVAEAERESLAQGSVESFLAGVPKGVVTEVVAQADCLGQILVQAQRAGDAARDARRLQRMRKPRAVVVTARIDEALRLVLEPAEGLRVHDPVAITLKRRSQAAVVLRMQPPACFVRADGVRRQEGLLLLANPRCEGVGDSP